MVIASIDLMDGKAVQLRQGREKVLQCDNPLTLAQEFNRYGETAVIDLNAAQGIKDNVDTIKRILRTAECRVGGGIRTVEQAKNMIDFGASRVILGSRVFDADGIDRSFLKELIRSIKRHRLIIAIDAVHGKIVTHAWTKNTGLVVEDIVGQLEPYCTDFLFTCVEREGMLSGTDLPALKRVLARTKNKITLAGGIHTLDEITACAKLGVDVQLGMALYTGAIDLGNAFIASLNWKSNLLPTIVQDSTGGVLMLAYSNRESLNKVFETKTMWYYSRSRKQLWNKGETSGNVQHLIKVRADCDQDAILATVKQEGVACHTGRYSCFGDKTVSP